MFKKIVAFIKEDRIRLPIWWVIQILSLYFYSNAFIGLNKPEIMPAVGGFATVFSWWFYTRQKGQNDDAAREYELDIIEMMVEFDIANAEITKKNTAADFDQRDYEIAKLRYEFGKLEDKVEERNNPRPVTQPNWSILASSMLPKSRYPRPKPKPNDVRYNYSLDTYKKNITNFKKAIEDHRKFSSRFSILEGVAILYSAALSVFGADFVRWVHS